MSEYANVIIFFSIVFTVSLTTNILFRQFYKFRVSRYLSKRGDILLSAGDILPSNGGLFRRELEIEYIGEHSKRHTRRAVCPVFGKVKIQYSLRNITLHATASVIGSHTKAIYEVEIDGEIIRLDQLPEDDKKRICYLFNIMDETDQSAVGSKKNNTTTFVITLIVVLIMSMFIWYISSYYSDVSTTVLIDEN